LRRRAASAIIAGGARKGIARVRAVIAPVSRRGGRRQCDDGVTSIACRESGVAEFVKDVVNSFTCANVKCRSFNGIACAGAVGGAVGAGSKDMGCARYCDPGEGRQMEAVESLIGDGVGAWQVARAARGRRGRNESGGVSCWCWVQRCARFGIEHSTGGRQGQGRENEERVLSLAERTISAEEKRKGGAPG
jgi:hypothetical protein